MAQAHPPSVAESFSLVGTAGAGRGQRPPERVMEGGAMRWITRDNIKVDRVACPWLIERFVDANAEFLFVPEADLLETAKREGATPFDAPRLAVVRLNHRGGRCTFQVILEDFHLTDPDLQRLGVIVRAADVKGQEAVAPEGPGLRAIAEGFAPLGSTMRSDCASSCAACTRQRKSPVEHGDGDVRSQR